MIPRDVQDALEAALGVAVRDARTVHGGDINQAARVTLRDGATVLLKWNRSAPPDFFTAEAHGLRELAKADAIRVPEALAVGATPAYLALEWIEEAQGGIDRNAFAEDFGRAFAALHRVTAPEHGLDRDNYIGAIPQINTPSPSWTTFYRERRIGAQMQFARKRGRLPREREDLLTRLQDWLDVFLDDATMTPSLLHGDLWGGNYMVGPEAEPVIIDPAVYYGHREADLAMTELFGGFPPRFYAAYNEAYPLDPGYDQRRELYQLYHVLNHMNLFGGGYAARADSIARRYVG
ncbi:MAG: fructosamine kinase family protein [Anaerolineae bacterium]|nr:fructosamine kinase family protein [Anaerolineae bacterium]